MAAACGCAAVVAVVEYTVKRHLRHDDVPMIEERLSAFRDSFASSIARHTSKVERAAEAAVTQAAAHTSAAAPPGHRPSSGPLPIDPSRLLYRALLAGPVPPDPPRRCHAVRITVTS